MSAESTVNEGDRWKDLQSYIDWIEKAYGPAESSEEVWTGTTLVRINVGDQFRFGDGTAFEVLLFQEKKDTAKRNKDVVCGYLGEGPIRPPDLAKYTDPNGIIILSADSVGTALLYRRIDPNHRIQKDFDVDPTYRHPYGPFGATNRP